MKTYSRKNAPKLKAVDEFDRFVLNVSDASSPKSSKSGLVYDSSSQGSSNPEEKENSDLINCFRKPIQNVKELTRATGKLSLIQTNKGNGTSTRSKTPMRQTKIYDFENEDQIFGAVPYPSPAPRVGKKTEPAKKSGHHIIGRFPTKKPIKSPRLNPPRYVNSIHNNPSQGTIAEESEEEHMSQTQSQSGSQSQRTLEGSQQQMDYDNITDIERQRGISNIDSRASESKHYTYETCTSGETDITTTTKNNGNTKGNTSSTGDYTLTFETCTQQTDANNDSIETFRREPVERESNPVTMPSFPSPIILSSRKLSDKDDFQPDISLCSSPKREPQPKSRATKRLNSTLLDGGDGGMGRLMASPDLSYIEGIGGPDAKKAKLDTIESTDLDTSGTSDIFPEEVVQHIQLSQETTPNKPTDPSSQERRPSKHHRMLGSPLCSTKLIETDMGFKSPDVSTICHSNKGKKKFRRTPHKKAVTELKTRFNAQLNTNSNSSFPKSPHPMHKIQKKMTSTPLIGKDINNNDFEMDLSSVNTFVASDEDELHIRESREINSEEIIHITEIEQANLEVEEPFPEMSGPVKPPKPAPRKPIQKEDSEIAVVHMDDLPKAQTTVMTETDLTGAVPSTFCSSNAVGEKYDRTGFKQTINPIRPKNQYLNKKRNKWRTRMSEFAIVEKKFQEEERRSSIKKQHRRAKSEQCCLITVPNVAMDMALDRLQYKIPVNMSYREYKSGLDKDLLITMDE